MIASPKSPGKSYAVVTCGLMAAVFVSGTCLLGSDAPSDICFAAWITSIVLLGVSQVVFIVVAARMKHPSVVAFLIVVVGFIILGAVVLFLSADLLNLIPS